jgi:hypothetical protein
MQQMLAGLKQQVRTRQERVPLSLLEEADDADPHDPRVRDQTAALSRALATLLGDAEEAHHQPGGPAGVAPPGRPAPFPSAS